MTNPARVALAATIALGALALAACDRDAASDRAERGNATVGQRLDSALDRTQQKLAEAGQKTEQQLQAAGEKLSAATDRAVAGTREAARDVKSSSIEVSRDVKSEVKSGDTGRVMSDTAITASIKTDYLKDPDLSVLKIDVDTRDGVVTLNGLADNEPAKGRAEKIASAVKGVKEVRNFLTIKRA
jgi:hyperosmotically inducible protein